MTKYVKLSVKQKPKIQKMKSITKQSLVLFSFLLSSVAMLADHHKEVEIEQTKYIPGTWKRTWINTDGKAGAMTKVIRATKETNHFVETINGNRQLRFKVEQVVGNILKFQGIEGRTINKEPSSWNDWEKNNLSYLFQVDEFFWNEVFWNLENSTKRRFSRVITGNNGHSYQDLARRKLSILKPMIGIWEGSVDMIELQAYGVPAHKMKIKHPVSFNKDESVIIWHWETDMLDAFGATSYDAHTGNIVTNYHTSTGAQMTAKLVSWNNNKFLWERHGNSPNGLIYEKCLIDLSNPDIFRHKIMDRTLNGLAQPDEPEILLNKTQ